MFSTTSKYIDTAALTRGSVLRETQNVKLPSSQIAGKTKSIRKPAFPKETNASIKTQMETLLNKNSIQKFKGWNKDLSKKIKALPGTTGENISEIDFITLSEQDLNDIVRSNIRECVLAVSKNKNAPNFGWCERRPTPVKYITKDGENDYCDEGDVGDKWMKIELEKMDATKYNEACFLVRKPVNKQQFLENFSNASINLRKLTYWFAMNVAGFALLKVPYLVKDPVNSLGTNLNISSVYIILTCTSQQFIFTIDQKENRAVLLSPVLFDGINELAKKKHIHLLSLRAATEPLINVYNGSGFRRSLDASDLKNYPEGDDTCFTLTLPACDKNKNLKHDHKMIIKGGTEELPYADIDVENNGFFMTRAV